MLCGGVAACQGTVCVLLAVLSAIDQLCSCDWSVALNTVHIPYLDMLPHHHMTYNDAVFNKL